MCSGWSQKKVEDLSFWLDAVFTGLVKCFVFGISVSSFNHQGLTSIGVAKCVNWSTSWQFVGCPETFKYCHHLCAVLFEFEKSCSLPGRGMLVVLCTFCCCCCCCFGIVVKKPTNLLAIFRVFRVFSPELAVEDEQNTEKVMVLYTQYLE